MKPFSCLCTLHRQTMQPIASTSKLPLMQNSLKRSASTVAAPLPVVPKKLPYRGRLSKPNRVYTKSKRDLFSQYTELLTTSPLVVFFRPTYLTPGQYNAFRAEVKALSPSEDEPLLKITHLRTNLLPPLFRTLSLPSSLLQPEMTGELAVLTMSKPEVDPPLMKSFLKVLDKHVKQLKNVQLEKRKYLPKSAAPLAPPEAQLKVVSAILEGRKELSESETVEFASLPGLDGLRGQIVGLLEAQARSLIGILGQASGAELSMVLGQRVKDLEPKAEEGQA